MKAVIVIGNNYKFNSDDFKDSYIIGVDKGALFCVLNNIKMDAAIGDFDSITDDQLKLVMDNTNCIKLNPIKDNTDTMEAIQLASNYDEILLLGGITGNRIEHFYANLLLLKKYPKLIIKDNNSIIFTANKSLTLDKSNYKFISIFSLSDNTILSLNGFKYNLNKYKMLEDDSLGISNEIIDNYGNIDIISGRILIILSKNDNE